MGKRISKARFIASAKGWLKPAANPVSIAADKPKSVKSKRGPLFAYNPSVGRLRAWADPLKGVQGIIGVL